MNRVLTGPAAGYLITALTIVGAVLLTALGHTIPDQLWTLAAGGLGAGAGATIPARYVETSTSLPATSTSTGVTP